MRVPHDDVGSIVSHPSARELPGISLRRAMNVSRGRLRERSGSALEHLQHVTRALADGADDAEQPGVSGAPAERPRIVIIDFANQQTLTPGIDASRRRPRFPDARADVNCRS